MPTHAHRASTRGARATVPNTLSPQLATLAEAPPARGDWSYEAKFDGYRVMARIDHGKVRLITRGGHDWTDRMPRVAAALSQLDVGASWIDGEVVVPGPNGAPDFQALQNAFDIGRDTDMQYWVFDLPFHDGKDLRGEPLARRRETLAGLVAGLPRPLVSFSEELGADAQALMRIACDMGLEGLIGKRRDAPYQAGRSRTWIKLKCTQRQEFVVGGFTEPAGSREGLGSLLLGVRDDAGRLCYAGNVGTGFDQAELRRLRKRLDAMRQDRSPFHDHDRAPKGAWVDPVLVAEVSFAQWTREGRLRHAVYHGLREDKPASRIVRERAVPVDAGGPPALSVSHPDRVIDPASGLTKLDLVRHYQHAAPWMLPHLKARPVALLRAPQGVGAQTFFQKHPGTLRIAGLATMVDAHDGERDILLEIPSAEALLGASQMNTFEFHTWNATRTDLQAPDRMVFDLDPGEGVDWAAVREAAVMVKTVLDAIGLRSYLKTTGGNGLHVVVPCRRRFGWDEVKAFSHAIVLHIVGVVPQRFVAKSGPRNRIGRIFIDYLRNGRGATTVAAYSARVRPGIGVSMPILWDELDDVDGGMQWTIANSGERFAALREDPWHAYWRDRQDLASAMKRMGFDPAQPRPASRRR
jgi:bifunctional non-homologous end joining protein LigD